MATKDFIYEEFIMSVCLTKRDITTTTTPAREYTPEHLLAEEDTISPTPQVYTPEHLVVEQPIAVESDKIEVITEDLTMLDADTLYKQIEGITRKMSVLFRKAEKLYAEADRRDKEDDNWRPGHEPMFYIFNEDVAKDMNKLRKKFKWRERWNDLCLNVYLYGKEVALITLALVAWGFLLFNYNSIMSWGINLLEGIANYFKNP